MDDKLEIYTDGSYRETIDKGAYGFIAVCRPDKELSHAACEYGTTNNVMEIKGVLAALEFINEHNMEDEFDVIKIYCDSSYVVNCINSWWEKWETSGFKTAKGPVKNKELLEQVMTEFRKTSLVRISWVKGHAANEYNNKIDAVVQALTKELFKSWIIKVIQGGHRMVLTVMIQCDLCSLA